MPDDTPSHPEHPWTLSEVAAYYREDQRTTRRRIERGELHPLRLPGSRRLLFDPVAVRSLLDSTEAER